MYSNLLQRGDFQSTSPTFPVSVASARHTTQTRALEKQLDHQDTSPCPCPCESGHMSPSDSQSGGSGRSSSAKQESAHVTASLGPARASSPRFGPGPSILHASGVAGLWFGVAGWLRSQRPTAARGGGAPRKQRKTSDGQKWGLIIADNSTVSGRRGERRAQLQAEP